MLYRWKLRKDWWIHHIHDAQWNSLESRKCEFTNSHTPFATENENTHMCELKKNYSQKILRNCEKKKEKCKQRGYEEVGWRSPLGFRFLHAFLSTHSSYWRSYGRQMSITSAQLLLNCLVEADEQLVSRKFFLFHFGFISRLSKKFFQQLTFFMR